jgi:hypothetical protein
VQRELALILLDDVAFADARADRNHEHAVEVETPVVSIFLSAVIRGSNAAGNGTGLRSVRREPENGRRFGGLVLPEGLVGDARAEG